MFGAKQLAYTGFLELFHWKQLPAVAKKSEPKQ